MSVITPEDLAKKLGLGDSIDPETEAKLQSIIDETQAMVEAYIGMPIESTEMVETLMEGLNGCRTVILPVFPIISIEEITVADQIVPSSSYWLDKRAGFVYPDNPYGCRRCCGFECTPGPTEIHYTAGFDPVPKDLELALLNLSADYYGANASNAGQTFGSEDKIKQVTIFGAMSVGFEAGGGSGSSASFSDVPDFLSSWTWILDKYQTRSPVLE